MNISLPDRTSAAAPRHSGGRVSLLALGTFAVGTDAFVVAGFLPRMADELGVSEAAAGYSVTVFAICYAVFSPLLATATATVPRRRLLVAALVVLGLANVGTALAPTFAILMATRVLAALGAAAYTPNAGAVASSLVSVERRGRALALVVSGLTVATAIGVPLGNLASRIMGWRTALGLVALLCLLVGVGLAVRLPRLASGTRTPLATRLGVLRNLDVQAILPVTVLGMAAAYTAYAYAIPAFDAVGVSPDATQWMLFLYGVGAVAGAQSSGKLTDRFGGTRVLITGYAVMTCTLAAFGSLSLAGIALPGLVGILAFTWGASSWCQTPPQQHRLIAAAPDEAPLVIALNSSGIYIGIALGTFIGGLAGSGNATWIFYSGAVIAVLAAIFLISTSRATANDRKGIR
ncbi:Predicted arabinose efflux permease, MFS family [Haloechinothrix alba]|uniref:Predicted arabinose efflux permease, MFS family n=1 Tax=Haloechinothrix alba TaxID=664784 RepID=A0A238VIJ4_9PSEU|nr:MFS transporter [Haloechinothrix alba]SNR33319.1 Predicted arabinose efflux permease, MFS family [Haloechinothrix alba]